MSMIDEYPDPNYDPMAGMTPEWVAFLSVRPAPADLHFHLADDGCLLLRAHLRDGEADRFTISFRSDGVTIIDLHDGPSMLFGPDWADELSDLTARAVGWWEDNRVALNNHMGEGY